ncbi:MAG: exodeoxyribonuclease VII large subunit, partial [Planctomycetota bacterium]|nr:exodeoxyribonuclease VII large subunit [Planctomycetota bacterium]
IDVTLADLVADVRALTPSEAAERIVPAADELLLGLRSREQRLRFALRRRATYARDRLDQFAARRAFRRPFDRLLNAARDLDATQARATRAIKQLQRLARHRVQGMSAQLESLSPLGILARGYSLATRLDDNRLITDASTLQPGDRVRTRLAKGEFVSQIESVDGLNNRE